MVCGLTQMLGNSGAECLEMLKWIVLSHLVVIERVLDAGIQQCLTQAIDLRDEARGAT